MINFSQLVCALSEAKGMMTIMKDLTKGNVLKLVIAFAIPIGLGNIFQLLYSLADTRIVGSFLGDDILAAVGATNSLNSMIIGFLLGMTNGFSIIVARRFGEKKEEELKKAVAATLALGIMVSVIFTVASVVFLPQILRLLNTPENLISYSYTYFRVILLGMTASMLYNAVSGLLRAIGDTITPLCFLALSTICNVVLDILMIGVFHQGVFGAAVATVISQSLSFVLCFVYMWIRYPLLRVQKHHFAISAKLLGEMFQIGCSMGFMISFVNIGSVALQMAINTFGDSIIVAHTAARKISDFFMMPFLVFGVAMATFCGQNLGAGKIDRIKKGLRQVILFNWGWCGLVLLMAYTVAPFFIQAVTGTNDTVTIETGALYLRVNTILYFVCAVIIVLRNAMQGIGDSVTPIVSSFLELATKVLVAVLLAPKLGYWAIIIAEPVSWVIMVIPLLVQIGRNPLLRQKKSS